MRVLIVDDEQAFAEPLAQRLELRGIEAAVAGDAETALGMLSRQEWDLVFLDVCLPGMEASPCSSSCRNMNRVPMWSCSPAPRR